MAQWYGKWNRSAPKLLWALVILGLLASLPLGYERIRTETSAKKVQFVMDYRDIVEIADYQQDPQGFVSRQLDEMKKAGIQSVAIYETTLGELKTARRIEVYDSRDAAVLMQKPAVPNENFTYVLFADDTVRAKIQPVLEQGFKRFQINTRPWTLGSRTGLVIEAPYDLAQLKPLGPDPLALELAASKQMNVVARLSNRHQPFVEAEMDALLAQYAKAGAKSVIVEGEMVPGYDPNNKPEEIKTFAGLMKKHGMALVSIELIKTPAGINTLAKEMKYDVLRGHSFTEADSDKLSGNVPDKELDNRIMLAADRFVLAVKDRNIRMIFLNARAAKNADKGLMTDPLSSLYKSVSGEEGALPRMEKEGFQPGIAHSFSYAQSGIETILKALTVLGAVALIALLLSYFVPSLTLLIFGLGLIGSAGLYVIGSGTLYKLLAFGVGVSASSIAMILAIKRLRRRTGDPSPSAFGFLFDLFIRTTVISLVGAVYVVGLLNHITYSLLLNQFTGVKLLGFLPILVVAIFVYFYSEELGTQERVRKVRKLLSSSITVLWVVLAAVIVGALYYYISRTGNSGTVSPMEMVFRSFLENTLGVRPRTKEFLIGHPLFLLGGYLVVKYRMPQALYLFLFGVIGQVDMIGTFTHLHTAIEISAIRVGYGLLFGTVIGLVLIGIWEILARSWKRWAVPFIE